MKILPIGAILNCIGTKIRKKKGILQRSAGTYGQLIEKGDSFSIVRLSSGQKKKMISSTFAVVGSVSKKTLKNNNLKKAGKNRWLGIRPSVRGVAMNPVDHPHGGGEGKTSGGRPSVTPWSRPAFGRKTKKKQF